MRSSSLDITPLRQFAGYINCFLWLKHHPLIKNNDEKHVMLQLKGEEVPKEPEEPNVSKAAKVAKD